MWCGDSRVGGGVRESGQWVTTIEREVGQDKSYLALRDFAIIIIAFGSYPPVDLVATILTSGIIVDEIVLDGNGRGIAWHVTNKKKHAV